MKETTDEQQLLLPGGYSGDELGTTETEQRAPIRDEGPENEGVQPSPGSEGVLQLRLHIETDGAVADTGGDPAGEATETTGGLPLHDHPTPNPRLNRGVHANGYRYGSGLFLTAGGRVPEKPTPPPVAGKSIATHGFEALDKDGTFVAWFECIVDALQLTKMRANTMVVRCSDRVMMAHPSKPRWEY